MPARTCPTCDARVPATAAVCPKCRTNLPAAADDGYEVVDAAPARRPVAKAVPARRRPAEDDEDDDDFEPRPRRRKPAGGGVPKWAWLAGGGAVALVLLVVLVVAALLFDVGAMFDTAAPPGFSRFRDPKGGYRVFLPGSGAATKFLTGPPNTNPSTDPNRSGGRFRLGDQEANVVAIRVPGYTPADSPDQLRKEYEQHKMHVGGFMRKTQELEATPVTLGGRPGLRLRFKEVPDLWEGKNGAATGFWVKKDKEETERVAREGVYLVVLVTTSGSRTVLIGLTQKGKEVDPATVDAVVQSFKFL